MRSVYRTWAGVQKKGSIRFPSWMTYMCNFYYTHTWKWIERYTIWERIGSPSLWKLRREDSEIELVSEVLGSLHIINSSDVRRKSHMLSSIDIHRYEMHAYEPALYVVCTNNSFTSIFSCKSSKQWAHIFTNLQAYSAQATNQVLILFCVNFCIYFESSFVSLHSSCLAR